MASSIATSPSANSRPLPAGWHSSLLIANPENRRVRMWQAAVRQSGRPESVLVSYADLLQGRIDLPPLLRDADVIRLDSPGENADVERLLILRGAARAGRDDVCPRALTDALADRGRIVHPGLWAIGYRDLLSELALLKGGDDREGEAPAEPEHGSRPHTGCGSQGTSFTRAANYAEMEVPDCKQGGRVQTTCGGSAGASPSQDQQARASAPDPSPRPSPPRRRRAGGSADCGGEGERIRARTLTPGHHPSPQALSADGDRRGRWLSDPGEVRLLFDKPACQRRLEGAGVPVPRVLRPVGGYEQLREVMREAGCGRVFVKLPGGSSASGVVALNVSSRRINAVTSVEVTPSSSGVVLYNSLRVRRYEEEPLIAALIDALAFDGPLHVEEWVPKAGLAGRTFDLRIVAIGGQPQHVVIRTSRGPLTNLHLGNRRGDLAALRRAVPQARWDAALESCRRVAGLFGGCLMLGIDLGLTPGFRRHFVIEVNAFGDLLPGVLHEGRDTYAAQVAAIDRGQSPQ